MRWWVVALLFACGCDRVFLGKELPFEEGPFQRTITISPSSPLPSDEFAVSVVTDGDDDLKAHARSDGTDIGFTALDGTPLSFERVAYADGSLEAWVKIDLRGQTQFLMIYGGDVIPFVREEVWPNDVIAVYHLSEDANRAEDSTRNGHHLSSVAGRDPATTEGQVGAGRAFTDGPEETCDQLCTPMGLHIGNSSFSFSLWLNAPAVNETFGMYDAPIYAGGNVGSAGADLEITANNWTANISDGTTKNRIQLVTKPTGTWAHVAFVIKRNANEGLGFVNGQRNVTAPLLTLVDFDTKPLCIGGPQGFGGMVDEVRIYSSAKQEDWFDAEFDNVMNRGTFITIGDEQPIPMM